jgi:lysyl-tRNA synthetase class 2
VSLNFAGMRRVYAGETRWARFAAVPLRLLDRWIELRTLYRFTAKFHPRWRPRELRMRSRLDLLPVAAAALTAEFGTRAAGRTAAGGRAAIALDRVGYRPNGRS